MAGPAEKLKICAILSPSIFHVDELQPMREQNHTYIQRKKNAAIAAFLCVMTKKSLFLFV